MRITRMDIIPVAFPDPPLRNSTGVHEPYALRTLVRLNTDEGIVGWGEAYGGTRAVERLEAAREFVVGSDPLAREALPMRLPEPRTHSALEVACLDIAGKALDQPGY